MNCELLDGQFGLELRWTLAPSTDDMSDDHGGLGHHQSDIILQLVSKTASDRYLAFGVRKAQDDQSEGKGCDKAVQDQAF